MPETKQTINLVGEALQRAKEYGLEVEVMAEVLKLAQRYPTMSPKKVLSMALNEWIK